MSRNGHLYAAPGLETIFVSGSMSFKTLPDSARERLDQHITNGSHFLVGDAPGVDTLVQQYLSNLHYTNVTVCHIGNVPRINFGFQTHRVEGNQQSDKDNHMALVADRGLAIWDGRSRGTKENIARLQTDVIKPPAPISR